MFMSKVEPVHSYNANQLSLLTAALRQENYKRKSINQEKTRESDIISHIIYFITSPTDDWKKVLNV